MKLSMKEISSKALEVNIAEYRVDVTVDIERLSGLKKAHIEDLKDTEVRIPLTQAVIYGWYDNEMGNYVSMLDDLTQYISES